MDIIENIIRFKDIITQTENTAHRKPGSVLLLAVSKQQSIKLIEKAFYEGIEDFGENYYQEALLKIKQLSHLPIKWHFIGPLQSNKVKGIAQHFDWVHGINRIKIAELLNEHRPSNYKKLQVCLQVNLVEEETKSGIAPGLVKELAKAVSVLPQIQLRGLMTIPPSQNNEENSYQIFHQLYLLMHELNQQLGLSMDTLSMGMSDDLIPAIKAGSTIVRIGQGIFGKRQGKSI